MFSTVDSGLTNLIQDGCSCTLFTLSSVDCSHSRLWAPMRVYFTLGKFPVEANSVVVTICIVGFRLSAMNVGNFVLQLSDISDNESSEACKRFAQPVSEVID